MTLVSRPGLVRDRKNQAKNSDAPDDGQLLIETTHSYYYKHDSGWKLVMRYAVSKPMLDSTLKCNALNCDMRGYHRYRWQLAQKKYERRMKVRRKVMAGIYLGTIYQLSSYILVTLLSITTCIIVASEHSGGAHPAVFPLVEHRIPFHNAVGRHTACSRKSRATCLSPFCVKGKAAGSPYVSFASARVLTA